MAKTALITGASDGIGLELAKIHASKGDNLVLVARRKDKLDQLKESLESKYKINVHTIGKDLSIAHSAQEVYNETNNKNIQIDYLINNAGFGDFGHFADSKLEKQLDMINLNVTTLTEFTKLYLDGMVARRSGKIMNIASNASFQPGPTMSVYCATKAYVLHFSEAIGNEVKNKGVTVTALCPGPTTSGFQEAANAWESKLVKRSKLATSLDVAKYGYKAMMTGKAVAIHGLFNYIQANAVRIAPRALAVKIARMTLDK